MECGFKKANLATLARLPQYCVVMAAFDYHVILTVTHLTKS